LSFVYTDSSDVANQNGLPLASVFLKTISEPAIFVKDVVTAGDGSYHFKHVPPEKYHLCAGAAGYESRCTDSAITICP